MNIKKVEKLMRGRKREAEDSLLAVIDGVPSFVPENPDNRHYQEIKKMESEGKLQIQERDIEAERVDLPQ